MKTSLLALAILAASLSTGCDRREVPENQPEPQPSDTADAATASQTNPSGADMPRADEVPADNTGAAASQPASAQPDDAVALGLLGAVNEHEIAAGKQAQDKGVTGDVLAFAKMMVTDHTANLAKTRSLGTLADNPEIQAMKKTGEDDLRTLGQGSGNDYARAYIAAMVKGHQEALNLIDDEMIPAATTEPVKIHLADTRKKVAAHLDMAKQLQAKL